MTHGRLVSIDSKESQIDLEVVHPSTGERAKRGLKPFGIFFLLGFCTVPIPIVHLVAPFVCWAIGISLGIKTFMETQLIRSGQGPCPVCANTVTFVNVPFHKVNKTICEKCRNQLKLLVP